MTTTAFIQHALESNPEVGQLILPLMCRNIPNIPAEEAKKLSSDLEELFREQKVAGTLQGITEAVPTMPAEALMQIQQLVEQSLAAYQTQEQAVPAEQEQPQQPM
jgi:hypothetical protein